jgi:hypothetical protein
MEILQHFQGNFENREESCMNSILSKWHEMSHTQFQSEEFTMLLNICLHPAFSSNLAWLASNNPPESCPCSITLLNQVAQAARSYLQCIAAKQESHQPVLCISLTMERVLQAGFVWIIYILYSISYAKYIGHGGSETNEIQVMSGLNLLEPLSCCQSILLSLSEKWRPGRPYYAVWNMIRNKVVDAFLSNACSRGPDN